MGGSLEVYETRYLHVAGDEGTDLRSPRIAKGTFYLDHSCDEWIIGDRVDALRLVNDILEKLGRPVRIE